MKFSPDDEILLGIVTETISDINEETPEDKNPILSIKMIQKQGIKKDSDVDNTLRKRLGEATTALNTVFKNIKGQIYHLNKMFAVLGELQILEQKTIEAISSQEGGNTNLSINSTGTDDYLKNNAQIKQQIIQQIMGPDFQVSPEIFFMNKKKPKKQKKKEDDE